MIQIEQDFFYLTQDMYH